MLWQGGLFSSLACGSIFFLSMNYSVSFLRDTPVCALIVLVILVDFVSASALDVVHVGFPVVDSLSVSALYGVPVVFVVGLPVGGGVLYPVVRGGLLVSIRVGERIFPVSVPCNMCPHPCAG